MTKIDKKKTERMIKAFGIWLEKNPKEKPKNGCGTWAFRKWQELGMPGSEKHENK